MADKGNTFIEIWSDNKLVDIILPEPTTTTAKSPTPLDRELVKVFRDRRALLEVCKNTRLELHVLLRLAKPQGREAEKAIQLRINEVNAAIALAEP